MSDENKSDGTLTLTASSVHDEIVNYSFTHPNDFGVQTDGRHRIPMKKLMKLFEIKKKSPLERQGNFRSIVNDICDLEVIDGLGKVLTLKENENKHNNDNNESEEPVEDYGYGDAAPTIQEEEQQEEREPRFRPPVATASGAMSIATADSFGVYDDGEDSKQEPTRRQGYRRRGSVTRYSIVAQDAVVDEYKQHEDVINQFRSDALKIDKSMKTLGINKNNDDDGASMHSGTSGKSGNTTTSTRNTRKGRQQKKPAAADAEGKGVKKFFRRGRFSLAF